MKAWLDPRQALHDPRSHFSGGGPSKSPERPERTERLKAGAEAAGCAFEAPLDAGLGPIAAVHSSEYLSFLETAHARWSRKQGQDAEVVPAVHPNGRAGGYPASVLGQAGWHQADTSCPIGGATWQSAYWSAQSAVASADAVLGGARAAYALCRPPGHHAFADMAGGFCFLSNSAIAAERCSRAGRRVAILDFHHGNGTQGVFWRRGDVLTVSIHVDPLAFYPFFWGYAHERGGGPGEGANLNLPLRRGSGDEAFLEALGTALGRCEAHGTDTLVVALGLDAHEDDPFRGLSVTRSGFATVGERLAASSCDIVAVQEGGYLSDALGPNLAAVLAPIAAR